MDLLNWLTGFNVAGLAAGLGLLIHTLAHSGSFLGLGRALSLDIPKWVARAMAFCDVAALWLSVDLFKSHPVLRVSMVFVAGGAFLAAASRTSIGSAVIGITLLATTVLDERNVPLTGRVIEEWVAVSGSLQGTVAMGAVAGNVMLALIVLFLWIKGDVLLALLNTVTAVIVVYAAIHNDQGSFVEQMFGGLGALLSATGALGGVGLLAIKAYTTNPTDFFVRRNVGDLAGPLISATGLIGALTIALTTGMGRDMALASIVVVATAAFVVIPSRNLIVLRILAVVGAVLAVVYGFAGAAG